MFCGEMGKIMRKNRQRMGKRESQLTFHGSFFSIIMTTEAKRRRNKQKVKRYNRISVGDVEKRNKETG